MPSIAIEMLMLPLRREGVNGRRITGRGDVESPAEQGYSQSHDGDGSYDRVPA